MKEQEMKRLIEENIPETPEAFHDRMNQTLNSIVVQERCQRMLETKNVPVRRARRQASSRSSSPVTVRDGSRVSSSAPSRPVPAPRSQTCSPRRRTGKPPNRKVSVEGRNRPSSQ